MEVVKPNRPKIDLSSSLGAVGLMLVVGGAAAGVTGLAAGGNELTCRTNNGSTLVYEVGTPSDYFFDCHAEHPLARNAMHGGSIALGVGIIDLLGAALVYEAETAHI